MISGIYMILCLSTNKFYIGRAFNLNARWRTHKHMLINNKHPNEYLQHSWNKYNENQFKFYVLEYVEKSRIIEREQHWIDKTSCLNREIGFNINPSAENSLGYKHSEEVKQKIRENTIRLGLKPPDNTGRKHSEETKLKQSLAAKGKPKSEQAKANMRGRIWSEESKLKLSISKTGYKHSEETIKKKSEAAKAKSSWPHENGNKCKCDECRLRRNEYYRNKNYPRNRKKIRNQKL